MLSRKPKQIDEEIRALLVARSELDFKIATLRAAEKILFGHNAAQPTNNKPAISAEGRANIAQAQRERWAKFRSGSGRKRAYPFTDVLLQIFSDEADYLSKHLFKTEVEKQLRTAFAQGLAKIGNVSVIQSIATALRDRLRGDSSMTLAYDENRLLYVKAFTPAKSSHLKYKLPPA